MRTIDGYEIVDGLRVWDYNLDRGAVDLSRVRPEVNQNDGSTAYWFEVNRDSGGRTLMSDTRVWRRHPSTGVLA